MFSTFKTFVSGLSSVQVIISGFFIVFFITTALVVVPNSGNILSWMGIKSKADWQAEALVLKSQLEDMAKANKEIKERIETMEQISEVNSNTIANLQESLELRQKQLNDITNILNKKVAVIKTDVTLSPQEKDKKIAETISSSLWGSYNQHTAKGEVK